MLFRMTTALVTIVALVVLLGACQGPLGPQGESGQTLDWSDTIDGSNLVEATYAIGLTFPEIGNIIIGSGFSAHYENIIWTNAHVALALSEILAMVPDELFLSADDMFAVRNGTVIGGPHTYKVDPIESIIHPEWDPDAFESPDLAAFRIGATFTDVPAFLPRAHATGLRVGQPIGTLGFPEEITVFGAVVPIATFKDGTISALRPYSADESATPENSLVVQHNLDLSGGTSGSAIFDHNGYIVAVNFGGAVTIIGDPDEAPEEIVVIPTGNIGFAIRVDEVWKLIDLIDAGALQAEVAASPQDSVHGIYRGFPEDWNGKTTFSGVTGQ